MPIKEPYEADDRGNVVDFYETTGWEQIGRIDREAEVGGVPDQSTWDGGDDVKAWAVAHGYPEVETMPLAP